jgi:hypothetical protein
MEGGRAGTGHGENNGKGIPELGSRTTRSMQPKTRIRGKQMEVKMHQIK